MLSCVRGYHEYQRVWMAAVGEELHFERETRRNPRYPYAIVVKKDGITVGHLPRKISRICSLFFNKRWKIFMYLIFTVWLNRETFYH